MVIRMDDPAPRRMKRAVRAIHVDIELCKACGICQALCPRRVFDTDKNGYPRVERSADCSVCMSCEWHCPDFAIEVTRDERTSKRKRNDSHRAED